MPSYDKIIAVDGNSLSELMKTFTSLVQDKFYKPIPYKDYTRLRKFNKEVELRFASSDGAVMIVPTEVGLSLLWWGKKDDNSLGEFLWGHFQEELKEMHPDEKKYDLYGLASKADYASADYDNCSVAALVSNIADTYADKISLEGICSADTSATTAIDWNRSQTNVATISTDSSWHGTWKTHDEVVDEKIAELKEDIAVKTKKLEETLLTRPTFEEMDYRDKCAMDDVVDMVDEARYEIAELYDEIRDIKDSLKKEREMKVKEAAVVPCVVYDMYGMPHETQGTVTEQATSSNYYPRKNYKINLPHYDELFDEGKEKESMDTNKMFNGFEFGPVDDRVKMSPYGMAIRNADGRYVSYDPKTANIVDVEVFNFSNHNLIYKMPVAVSAIAVGDTVIHMKKPMFVTSVTNGITVIDIFNGEVKTIMPTTNMFGFNFVTKVVSLFNFTGANTPSAENPFGNILPFMLMGDGKDFKDILPMLMLTGNANMFGNMAQNPLMLYALMGDKGSDIDPLMLIALTGGFNNATSANTCNCGCGGNHDENHN